MEGRFRHLIVGAGLTALLLAAAVPVLAADEPVRLSLHSVGMPTPFFDLHLAPGEVRELTVELGNGGTAALSVRTAAADVYTIINGGFGARLRGESISGTTAWLTYPTDVFVLAAGERVQHPLRVAVPPDALPGQYITSIVLENEAPIAGTGTVRLDQVIRNALAVKITVPGNLVPGLAIGSAGHRVVAGNSVVAVAVANTGNMRLKPVIGFSLFDPSGAEISTATVPMDTFYGHTATFVEMPLSSLLAPGVYSVRLALDDDVVGAHIEKDGIELVVSAGAEPVISSEDPGSGLIGVSPSNGSPAVPTVGPALIVAAGSGVAVALILGLLAARRRRRSV